MEKMLIFLGYVFVFQVAFICAILILTIFMSMIQNKVLYERQKRMKEMTDGIYNKETNIRDKDMIHTEELINDKDKQKTQEEINKEEEFIKNKKKFEDELEKLKRGLEEKE